MEFLKGLPPSSRRTLTQLFDRVQHTPKRVRFDFNRWVNTTTLPGVTTIEQMKNDGRIPASRAEEIHDAYVDTMRQWMVDYIAWLQSRVRRTRRLK